MAITTLRRLHEGLSLPDKSGRAILYRYLKPSDDLDEITALLHEAYAPLASAGMRFVASHQDVSATRRRTQRGETIVAMDEARIVAIVTLANADRTGGAPFYDRPDVANFGQFAVRPSYQRRGIGSALMNLVEQRAREQGVAVLALDTSEDAAHLIAMYEARGYAFVEHLQWPETNYRSVLLAKPLNEARPD